MAFSRPLGAYLQQAIATVEMSTASKVLVESIDVGIYEAVLMRATFTLPGRFGLVDLLAQWSDDNRVPIAEEVFQAHVMSGSAFQADFPVRGRFLTLTALSNNAAIPLVGTVRLVASGRPVPRFTSRLAAIPCQTNVAQVAGSSSTGRLDSGTVQTVTLDAWPIRLASLSTRLAIGITNFGSTDGFVEVVAAGASVGQLAFNGGSATQKTFDVPTAASMRLDLTKFYTPSNANVVVTFAWV